MCRKDYSYGCDQSRLELARLQSASGSRSSNSSDERWRDDRQLKLHLAAGPLILESTDEVTNSARRHIH